MNDIQYVGELANTYEVRWHTHDCWELVYCTGGAGCFQFENGTEMNYREGEAIAIPPEEVHCNVSRGGFANIHIRMAEPAFPYRTPFRVSDDQDRHLRVAFQQSRYYYLSDIHRCELVLAALGELITSYMVVYRSNSEYSEPVEQIRTAILRGFARTDFALDAAIGELPFHYDYLRKLFKKEVGVTPLEYMTRLRMKKASTMLMAQGGTGYSVAEIARLCGYDDALYFSRVFKKVYGLAPSAYASRNSAQMKEEI